MCVPEWSFIRFYADDVPQIPRRQMTPTKSHSPRGKFWISLIKTENGGRRGKRMAQWVVRSIIISLTSSIVADPHFVSFISQLRLRIISKLSDG